MPESLPSRVSGAASSNNPATPGTSGASDSDRPPWWVVALILGVGGVLLMLYGWSVKSAQFLLILLLLAVAAFVVGGFVGFLFGIPKSVAEAAASQTGQGAESPKPARGEPGYQPSTNLEQVSDWLTKILIGVGLVQLTDLGSELARLGTLVSASLPGPVAGGSIVTQAVVVAFAVVGFLSTYLWTRLYYGEIQALADSRAFRSLKLAYQGLLETTTALASGTLARPIPPTPKAEKALAPDLESRWPETLREKVKALLAAPSDYDSDPIAELFPKVPAEAGGRRLEAEIVANLETALTLQLRVVGVTAPPLIHKVTFLLHPTFRDRVLPVEPSNGVASYKVYSEGWFTVGAILDDEQTVLTYDLRKVPNAPRWFVNQ